MDNSNDFEVIEQEKAVKKNGFKKFLFFMKSKKWFRLLIEAVMVLLIIVLAGTAVKKTIQYNEVVKQLEKLQQELVDQDDDVITYVVIEEKMEEINELSTMVFDYTGKTSEPDSRKFFNTDLEILFTENEITVTYQGVVKAGFDVSKMETEIDEEKKILFVTLPEVQIFDSYIDNSSLVIEEKNNVFNPISVVEFNDILTGIEEAEKERAISQGLNEKAEEHMKEIVKNTFAEFSEYDVVFQ